MPVRQRDGSLRQERGIVVAQADPRPPKPTTGIAVSGCYAAPLADCAGDLEGEHFVSHRMLKMLAGESGVLNVKGIAPQNPDLERRVAVKRLTANVLCARHNRAMKPIDTAGNNFFETVATLGNVLEDAPPGAERIVALNGHDLERWCLKTLCGFLARAGKPVPDLWVRILFGHGSLLQPRGLYIYAAVGDVLSGDAIGITEVRVKGGESVGLFAQLLNHELVFSMAPASPVGVEEHVGKWRVYRPESFTFKNPANGSTLVLWLSWQDWLYHAPIDTEWSAGKISLIESPSNRRLEVRSS